MILVALVLGTQAVCFLADEFIYHYRRGLPRWERIGHPIDTASIVLCIAIAVFALPSQGLITLYAICALISCVLVTKDEWVHARECEPMEHWLHAMLFILHPMMLGLVGWEWIREFRDLPRTVIAVQLCVIVLFGFYQIIYWNLLHERK